MSHRKGELPGWFPFAVIASAIVALGAGVRSGWKLSGASSKPPAMPPIQTGGVLQDWGSGSVRFG